MEIWYKIKENRVIIFTIIILVLIGISYLVFFNEKEEILLPSYEQNTNAVNDIMLMNESLEKVASEQMLVVDIKGAVQNPGVYEIVEGSRVNDVISIAGGILQEADVSKVNLAAIVKDGQVVFIPQNGEETTIWGDYSSVNISGQVDNNLININTANSEELQKLPGIGPSKALAIITYREEKGLFKDVNDLVKVSGIGQKTLDKLLPMITIR